MRKFAATRLVVLLVVLLKLSCMVRHSHAKPLLSRVKRISDQRLAELETLIALDKLKGKLITVPAGIGLDPMKIGRKRRADPNMLAQLFTNDLLNRAVEEEEEEDFDEAIEDTEAELAARLQNLRRMQHLRRRYADEERRNERRRLEHQQHLVESDTGGPGTNAASASAGISSSER